MLFILVIPLYYFFLNFGVQLCNLPILLKFLYFHVVRFRPIKCTLTLRIHFFQFTRLIIEYVEDKDNENMESWSGYILALAMFLIAMIQTICLQNNFHLTYTAGMRIRTAVIGAVYRKVNEHIFSHRKIS
jgi:hypothetical protein